MLTKLICEIIILLYGHYTEHSISEQSMERG
jgi:hypothetical protein